MTSLIRLIFPDFDPAPTVENFGARAARVLTNGATDDRAAERELDELLDRPRSN